ncbi:MAG: YbaB/EbfC family nucleoid-associated protein [Patescibacteria group bacterium]|nr:YbaB/EbfC family nucleoid-associated protein [Patescibacteria group bacterium]
MFDKLKQMQKLNELKKILEQEKIEVEEQGVKIIVNGKMEVESIQLNSDLSIEQQEQAVKQCFNQAMKKIQMTAVQKMSGITGF